MRKILKLENPINFEELQRSWSPIRWWKRPIWGDEAH
jgi:hypothetical protein